jgi:hypothetical protein
MMQPTEDRPSPDFTSLGQSMPIHRSRPNRALSLLLRPGLLRPGPGLRKTGGQGIVLRGEVLFIEVDAKALNPLKTTSIHNAARMVESCATKPIRGGPARKPT